MPPQIRTCVLIGDQLARQRQSIGALQQQPLRQRVVSALILTQLLSGVVRCLRSRRARDVPSAKDVLDMIVAGLMQSDPPSHFQWISPRDRPTVCTPELHALRPAVAAECATRTAYPLRRGPRICGFADVRACAPPPREMVRRRVQRCAAPAGCRAGGAAQPVRNARLASGASDRRPALKVRW